MWIAYRNNLTGWFEENCFNYSTPYSNHEQMRVHAKEMAELKGAVEEKTAKMRELEDLSAEKIKVLEKSLLEETAIRKNLEEDTRQKMDEVASLQSRIDG